jgi:ribonucleoside-diphosphate reductase alpha chain
VFELGERTVYATSAAAALGQVVRHRVEQLGALTAEQHEPTPVMDALFARKEPKSGTDGTMSWSVDVANPQTGDDFVLFLKELVLPNGQRRPVLGMAGWQLPARAGWPVQDAVAGHAGDRPGLDRHEAAQAAELCRAARRLLCPHSGPGKSQSWPSTVAYMAQLMIHRYAMLGVLTQDGVPLEEMGVMVPEQSDLFSPETAAQPALKPLSGKPCPECGNHALIKKDGCEFCTACGHVGACG